MSRLRAGIAISMTVCAVLAAGCGQDDPDEGGGEAALSVVATTTQLADFATEVGGERVEVHRILDPNTDPHDYEPRPSDARALADADVILRSGGDDHENSLPRSR